MRPILLSSRMNYLKTIALVKAAQVFRVLREYWPDAGLPLAACVGLARWRHGEDVSPIGDQPQNILVIRLDAMGDLVMTTSIFRELKQAYPKATITALVPRANFDILETNPFVDQIIVFLPIKRSLLLQRVRRVISIVRLYWKSLRGKHFYLAVQPRLGPDYFGANLLLTLVSASSRIKYEDDLKRGPSKYFAKFAYRSVTQLHRPAFQHEVLSNKDFVRQLTERIFHSRPEIFLRNEDRSYAEGVFKNIASRSIVICVAFGAQAKRRQWPLERWAETLCLLAQNRNIAVLILCSRAETWEGERLHSMLNSVLGTNNWIVSGARLREVAACIQGCDLLLGADSGLAHIAAAVGCSVLVVSPHPVDGDPCHENSPLRFKPYSERARVIQPKTSRYPCRSGCDAVEPHCILDLMPSQIAEVAEEMLLINRSALHMALRGQNFDQHELPSSSRALDAPIFTDPYTIKLPSMLLLHASRNKQANN